MWFMPFLPGMVTARVLDIDSANRRLALSLRQVAQWDQRAGSSADTELGSLNVDASPSPYGNEERLP